MALILSGSSANATLDSSAGLTFSDSSNQSAAASPYVLKNRIINGAMQIWQRGTSFTVAGGTVTYTADRFGSYTNNTNMTISRNTNVPTTAGSLFPYSIQLQRPASSTQTNALFLNQVIESVNCYDMAGQNVTLSFWAKAGTNFSASGSSMVATIITGTVADQSNLSMLSGTWTGMATNFYTPTITTTWTKYTYTVAIPSNTLEIGIQFYFTPVGTAGADDSVYITGVQLEIGASATPFERRLYNQELANCQRYYQQFGGGSTYQYYGTGQATNTTNAYCTVALLVSMRSTPSFSVNAAGNFAFTSSANSILPATAISMDQAGTNSCGISGSVSSGLAAGNATRLVSNATTSAQMQFSAEL